MIIKELKIENIGPFKDAKVTFPIERNSQGKLPVTIITGENGTGKSIILDSIRALFKGHSAIERDIVAQEPFLAQIDIIVDEQVVNIQSTKKATYGKGFSTNNDKFNKYFREGAREAGIVDWVLDYWTSSLATDSFKIDTLATINPNNYLHDALSPHRSNIDLTKSICYFDYLRESKNPKEKELGEAIFMKIEEAIKSCLLNGEFKYVSRTDMSPIVEQNGNELTLEKLSSGNLLLIERIISLIGKMYSVFILNHKKIDDLFLTKGVLLIDEVENHLHPKWQKTFVDIIQSIFPSLQIILTTHSPFIVAAAKDAHIYVCSAQVGYSEITDVTQKYSNMPIDEILLTPVFSTQPFNEEISLLIKRRKQAISENNHKIVPEIEQRLLELNPEYFSYLDIENKIGGIEK